MSTMTTAVRCTNHPERAALGYCSTCGKPLCTACLVRLSTGNYCNACANAADRPAGTRRAIPWWAIIAVAFALLLLLRLLLH
jgi:hypothetical protein